MKRSRGVATGVALAVTAALLAACSPGAAGEEESTVRLATGVDPSYTVVFVAEENGYFEDHGVDVEVSKLEGGPAMAQAITADQADMATQSDATSITQMANNPDLRALADFQHSDTYIKVVWGPNVKDPKEITKLATLPGIMTVATVRYLESVGVDPESVELVNASPPDVPVMLENGDVDGTVIYEPWATRSAEDAGGQIVGTIGDFDVTYAQWLISDATWLSENEEDAAKVLAALKDANDFVRDNPEETTKIIEDAIKMPTDQSALIMKDLVFETRDIDEEALQNSKDTAQFFVDAGDMKEMPDLDEQILTGWMTEHLDQ